MRSTARLVAHLVPIVLACSVSKMAGAQQQPYPAPQPAYAPAPPPAYYPAAQPYAPAAPPPPAAYATQPYVQPPAPAPAPAYAYAPPPAQPSTAPYGGGYTQQPPSAYGPGVEYIERSGSPGYPGAGPGPDAASHTGRSPEAARRGAHFGLGLGGAYLPVDDG